MGKVYFIEAARQYRTVVRRKGGDALPVRPAQAKIAALQAVGVESEIVPGVPVAMVPVDDEQPASNRAEAEDAFRVYGDSWFR